MTDLRKAAEDMLETLDKPFTASKTIFQAKEALRQALAQPEQDCYGYASRLATNLWEAHYKYQAPEWKPFDNLAGVLTQIDNMTSGLVKAQPEQEPVGTYEGVMERMLALLRGTVQQMEVYEHFKNIPLYTAPPKRDTECRRPEWVGLTDDEFTAIARKYSLPTRVGLEYFKDELEAKLKEKNT